ncbi:hypothetical protein [Liquorilactobacillus hordei]|uniref:hypothetical protein n=1 Tax=Liquorilactobacillus hordei TaxID=468911 RepID=UPI0039E9C776
MLHKTTYESPLGDITLLSDEVYLLGLWIKGQKNYGSNYNLETIKQIESKPIHLAKIWLEQYFAGNNPDPITA